MSRLLKWSSYAVLLGIICIYSAAQSNSTLAYPSIGLRYLSPYQGFGLSDGVTSTYLKSGSVVVMQAETNSPAFTAGLRPGDVILTANGKRVCQADDMRKAVAEGYTADLTLTYSRGGRLETAKMRAVNRPSFDPNYLAGLNALPRITAAWDRSDYRTVSVECERLRDPDVALTSVACAQVYYMKGRGISRGEENFGRAEAICPKCPDVFASHAVGRRNLNMDYLTPWNAVEAMMKEYRAAQEQAFAAVDTTTVSAMKELAEGGKVKEAMARYSSLADAEAGCRDTPPSKSLAEFASTLALRENPSLAVPPAARHRAESARGMKKVATKSSDLLKAYIEMNAAIWLAPWWSAAYSDAADMLEVAGRPAESMEMANRALSLPHAKADATEAATAAAPEPEDRNLAPEVALQRYVASLATVEPASPEEQRIRGRCISSALKMNPPPEVPAQASRHLARGQAALEMAKTTSDFNDAAEELERAVRLAPWWADGYHELGAAYEKATNYQQAMNAYQLYLAAAPTAPDSKEVKSKIYKLEYAAEREQKQSIEKSMQQRQQSARILAMQGLWADKSGMMWQASLQSGLFVAQRSGYREGDISYNGNFVLRSSFKGDGIEGTMLIPQLRHVPSGCDVTQSEQPLTGMISPDGKTLTVKYQETTYNYEFIKATLLTNARCVRINKLRDDMKIIVLEKR